MSTAPTSALRLRPLMRSSALAINNAALEEVGAIHLQEIAEICGFSMIFSYFVSYFYGGSMAYLMIFYG